MSLYFSTEHFHILSWPELEDIGIYEKEEDAQRVYVRLRKRGHNVIRRRCVIFPCPRGEHVPGQPLAKVK